MTTEELIIKAATPIVTIIGILVGIWQFLRGQRNLQEKELQQRRFEALAKFKEIQYVKYKEATETVSAIIYTDDFQSDEFKKGLKRFWQLYWVELSSVEDAAVESAMKRLGDHIQKLEDRQFENLTEEEQTSLQHLGYAVAQAIKESSKNWEMPHTEL